MSFASFDPDALASSPARAALGTLRVELRPDGIAWSPPRGAGPRELSPALLEALLEAWERVAAALAFRHERILNLAYVPTTTGSDALRLLARSLALKPEPALAASTWLALTVQAIGGNPECQVPEGLEVQSVPQGAGRPQTFSSDRALRAHVAWNALRVRVAPPAPPVLQTNASSGCVTRSGVAAGRRILLRGAVAGAPWYRDVTLESVELLRGKQAAQRPRQWRLSWSAPPPGEAPRPLQNACASELASACGLYGANAAEWSKVPAAQRYALSKPRGGLLRLTPPRADGTCEAQPNAAFSQLAGEPCAVAARDQVWLAASAAGVFRSSDLGRSWQATGSRSWRVSAVCWSGAGLFLGTASHGVLRSTDAGLSWELLRGATVVTQGSDGVVIALGRLPRCSVAALGSSATDRDAWLLLAGTQAGPYYQLLGDNAWYPQGSGLPLSSARTRGGGPSIRAVVLDPGSGAWLLGTDRGLFRSPNLNQAWQAVPLEGQARGVTALCDDGQGAVLVALDGGGLFRLSNGKAQRLTGLDATRTAAFGARALCVTRSGLWLGSEVGCFWSRDGQSWREQSSGTVAGLAALADGGVLAATRLEGTEHSEWPGFALRADQLDLERVLPLVRPGPALVIDRESGKRQLVQVLASAEVELTDFGLHRRVTRLQLRPEPALLELGRRTTVVHTLSRELGEVLPDVPAAADAPAPEAQRTLTTADLLGSELVVDGRIPDPTGRDVLVAGPLLRTRLPRGTVLHALQGPGSWQLGSEALATLRALPLAREGKHLLHVRTEDGLEGTALLAELSLLPGDAQGPLEVRRRQVLSFQRDTQLTRSFQQDAERAQRFQRDAELTRRSQPEAAVARLTLSEPLDVPLDPDATQVFANVVSATHARRIENEVLGSGDPTVGGQRFKLLQPLCWTPTVSGSAAPRLELRVSGHLWRRAADLAELGPSDRAYALETDLEGNTWLCLGDGEHGERPPAGVENLVASYHSGGGSAGNQPALAIRLLSRRPPGVKGARNWLPASGGSDVESFADLRARIPLHARLPDHVVSLPDLRDHLATLEGIAKVSAQPLWNGHAHVVHLTIASSDAQSGWQLAPDSELARSLNALAARAAVQLDSVEVAYFDATLEVAVAPDLEPAAVLPAVRAALHQGFGFAAREIGAAVVPSALIATAMSVPGVLNAALRSLHPSTEPATAGGAEPRALPGALARLDASGVVRPGRLWLLAPELPAPAGSPDPTQGLIVKVMATP